MLKNFNTLRGTLFFPLNRTPVLTIMKLRVRCTANTLNNRRQVTMTFGAFISAKRKELRLTLRETAKHLGIACGYLSDVEQSRRPAPEGDFVERISRYLDLSKTDHERLLDLAAKSRNRISADLPEYIMQKDIVRAALRVSKDVNATDEEWQAFIEQMKNRPR